MADIATEAQSSGPLIQKKVTEPPLSERDKEAGVPASGRRAAFRDVRRQLTDAELTNPGVLKLLLDMLEEAWSEIEVLSPYQTRFHDADKNAAILSEKVKTINASEIFFGVGFGLGGSIIGLAPYFHSLKPEYGVITSVVGLAMMVGSTIGRIKKI